MLKMQISQNLFLLKLIWKAWNTLVCKTLTLVNLANGRLVVGKSCRMMQVTPASLRALIVILHRCKLAKVSEAYLNRIIIYDMV